MEPDDVYPRDRDAWRRWLAENHASSRGAWLVYDKKSGSADGTVNLTYDDAVEEALCYGWIDSRVNAVDATRYRQWFCPRKPKSVWSGPNKERIERMVARGLMTDAGLAKIEEAKRDGSWAFLDAIEALVVPEDLAAALDADADARRNFDAFADSAKKVILTYVASARRPETRAKRVAEVVSLAARNLRAVLDPRPAP